MVGAENQRLLVLVDLGQENLHALLLALADLDAAVEVAFLVNLARLDLALHHGVVGRVNVVVERRLNLLHLERREEAVVDAFLERVDVNRLAEVGVGVHVVLALGRGSEAELHRRGEVVEDVAPVALVVGAAAMALVDDDEIEEIFGVFPKIGSAVRSRHERLEDGEEQAAVLGGLALLTDVCRFDAHQRVLGEGGERVVGLVRQNVPVGEKEDAWLARGFAAQVPAGVKEFPRDLERDEGFAGAGGKREQDALPVLRDGLHHALDGDVLIIAAGMRTALVLKRHGGEAVAPRVRLGEGHRPEFVGRGIACDLALGGMGRMRRMGGRGHIHLVDAFSVGGVGELDRELRGVVLGLADTGGEFLVPRLGLNDGELGVAIDEHVVGDVGLAAPPVALDATGGDTMLAQDFAAFDDAPTDRFQGGVDMLGACLGFVHWSSMSQVMSQVAGFT